MYSFHFEENISATRVIISSASLDSLHIFYQTLYTALDRCLDHFKGKKWQNVIEELHDWRHENDVCKFPNVKLPNISYERAWHDQGFLIPKTVPRYDEYFSSYSNWKKFQFPPPQIRFQVLRRAAKTSMGIFKTAPFLLIYGSQYAT